MMRQRTYRLIVVEVDGEVTDEGCTPIELEVATYLTESCCAHDAVLAVADRLADEHAS